jgi:hypothetical protein
MFDETNYADDGSWVDVEYAGADTSDSGRVTILTVTVTGRAAGSTAVSLGPSGGEGEIGIYDEEGSGYDLSSATDATLSVDGGGPDDRSGSDDADGGRNAPSDGRSADPSDESADGDSEDGATAVPPSADGSSTPEATEVGDGPATAEQTASVPPASETATPEPAAASNQRVDSNAGPDGVVPEPWPLAIVAGLLSLLLAVASVVLWRRGR